MHVIFWQIAVIATILGSYHFPARLVPFRAPPIKRALIAAILWSGFSLWEIFFPPLLVIQLVVIWGTWLLIWRMEKQARRIMDLGDLLEKTNPAKKEQVEELARAGSISVVSGPQHLKVLHRALDESRVSICVLSGWVSSAVVDGDFERRLKQALGRGVDINLGYGWKSSGSVETPSKWQDQAKRRLSAVSTWSEHHSPGTLRLVDFAERPGDAGNHVKLLVWDRRHAICGSNNWLSNRNFKNKERSWMVSDDVFAAAEHDEALAQLSMPHR